MANIRSPEEFQNDILDLLQEFRWGTPTVLEQYLRVHVLLEPRIIELTAIMVGRIITDHLSKAAQAKRV